MPKNKNILNDYNNVCEDLSHAPDSLDTFKNVFAPEDTDLLEAIVCKIMNWKWIWEDTSGAWDGLAESINRWKELKVNRFTGNAQEGTGKISGKCSFHNFNPIKKCAAFVNDPCDLVLCLFVFGKLEAIIEVRPTIKNGDTAQWVWTLIDKCAKKLKMSSAELKEACLAERGDGPQMPTPELSMCDWKNDDYTVTLFVDKDELTEHAYTKSILKILKNEGVSL